MNILREWYSRYSSDPQVVILAVLLIVGFIVVLTMGEMLAPVIVGAIIAYLLDGVVGKCDRLGAPRLSAVILVFILFLTFLLFALIWMVPQLSSQVTQLFQQLPNIIARSQEILLHLPEKYPNIFTEQQVSDLMHSIRSEITDRGQNVLSWSVASVVGLMTLVVYIILVPVLAFFFLKDKHRILDWFSKRLPSERRLADKVWHDVNQQVSNYVRGKVWEICIVGSVTFSVFKLMGLQYALLLSTLVALSVIIAVCHHSLYRCCSGDFAGCCYCLVPVGLDSGSWLVVVCLRDHSGTGWLLAGATVIFRSCRSAPGSHHYCDSGLWRIVGPVGGFLCDSAGDTGTGSDKSLAN